MKKAQIEVQGVLASIAPNDTAFGMICPRVKISAGKSAFAKTFMNNTNASEKSRP